MIEGKWIRCQDGHLFASIPPHNKIKCPFCGEMMNQHIFLENWRNHVLSWSNQGMQCSDNDCEINHRNKCKARKTKEGKV